MVAEKQKAEEEREARQASREETAEGRPSQEPPEDKEHSLLEPEVWLSQGPPEESFHPEESPSPEMVPSSQKTPPESHEKVPSSREKRESRRQRGLEHVELQNKHIQSYKDGNALREPFETASPEQEERLSQDRKESREGEALADTGAEAESPAPENQPRGPPPTLAAYHVPGETPQAPQDCMERPTSLALDSGVGTPAPVTTPEKSRDKSKPSGGPKAQDRPVSPGGSTQIQRYREPVSERLASAVELWRGKNLMTTGPSAVLSQSLDLSERHRATGTSLTATE